MSILESTFAGGMETAIRTRLSFDTKAREALQNIDGCIVQFNVSGQKFHLKVVDSHAEVRASAVDSPNLELTGSMSSISQALMTADTSNVSLQGEESILSELNVIFGPPIDPKDVSEKAKAARDYGVAAAKSAMETISSQFANLTAGKEIVSDLEGRVAELEREVEVLKSQRESEPE